MHYRKCVPVMTLSLRAIERQRRSAGRLTIAYILAAAVCSTSHAQHNNDSHSSQTAAPLSLEELVQNAQTSVVQIEIRVDDQTEIKDPELRRLFGDSNFLTVGTGFIVNDRSDVVTADHVVKEMESTIAKLGDEKISSIALIGVPQQGVENATVRIVGTLRSLRMTIKARNSVRDVAIVAPTDESIFAPFNMFSGATDLHQDMPSVAKINIQRPHDGADVFACGFPLGSKSIITTSGHIASAWSSDTLHNTFDGRAVGESEAYILDIRLNRGNSGGPLFSSKDQSVIGMVVAVTGTVGKAVPSKYIVEMLNANHISWSPSQ
jgi:S1-C subfamily serine protease